MAEKQHRGYERPAKDIDEWASSAKDWVRKLRRPRVLVVGDIIHDNYIVASPLENRDPFGVLPPLQYPDTPQSNIRALGGAAKGFEFIRKFTPIVRILGTVGDDSEGNWTVNELADIDSKSVAVKVLEDISTPMIQRVFCPHLTESGSPLRYSRLDRYDKNQKALMSIDETDLEKEMRGVKLILVFDHGLGTVPPSLLGALNQAYSSVRGKVTTKRPYVVARLKHCDVLAYRDIALDALVLNWAHIAPAREFPRTADDIKRNTHTKAFLLDFLSKYPKCRNFIFFGKGGDILLQARLPGSSFSANLYSYSRVNPATEIGYYSGAGHIFTGVVGLALACEKDCTPESAVCLGLIAAIVQRKKESLDLLDRRALYDHIDQHPASTIVSCVNIHLLTDQKCRDIQHLVQTILNRKKIMLKEATDNSLNMPAVSDSAFQFIGNLVSGVRGGGASSIIWIHGESGTGKTRIAASLHQFFKRDGRLLIIPCDTASPEDIKSWLEKTQNGGTLVLDEIGWDNEETRMIRQGMISNITKLAKGEIKDLLLVLTSSTDPDTIDPPDIVGRVREKGKIVRIPSLSETYPDIPYLTCEFVKEYNTKNNTNINKISSFALTRLILFNYGKENRRKLSAIVRELAALLKTTA